MSSVGHVGLGIGRGSFVTQAVLVFSGDPTELVQTG